MRPKKNMYIYILKLILYKYDFPDWKYRGMVKKFENNSPTPQSLLIIPDL